MGDFEAFLLGDVESSVKYHSLLGQFLTRVAKPFGDSAWQAVLVGRYPRRCHCENNGNAKPWRPTKRRDSLQKNKSRGHPPSDGWVVGNMLETPSIRQYLARILKMNFIFKIRAG